MSEVKPCILLQCIMFNTAKSDNKFSMCINIFKTNYNSSNISWWKWWFDIDDFDNVIVQYGIL